MLESFTTVFISNPWAGLAFGLLIFISVLLRHIVLERINKIDEKVDSEIKAAMDGIKKEISVEIADLKVQFSCDKSLNAERYSKQEGELKYQSSQMDAINNKLAVLSTYMNTNGASVVGIKHTLDLILIHLGADAIKMAKDNSH